MKSIVFIGMDIHKNSYSLCCYDKESGENADKFLKGFKGYLINDAYQGYNKVEGVTRCYCWAHLRRYFVEALSEDLKSEESSVPQQAIEKIGQLFKIEEEIANKSAEERLRIRKEKSAKLVDEFFAWVEENQNKYLSKSKLGKAFKYALNQKEGLKSNRKIISGL